MNKLAFLFPGQGSQKVGMGKDLVEKSVKARLIFEEADEILGFPLSRLCFEGEERELSLTKNTQPALLTFSYALLQTLEIDCDFTAGHSLGEYSAHLAAKTFEFADALKLVRLRGQFMQEAVGVGEGGMSAVLGVEKDKLVGICNQVSKETGGVVEAANFNCPGQIVLAGDASSLAKANQELTKIGAKVIPLNVSAPFHCSLMKPVAEKLRIQIEQTPFQDPTLPIYANVDAQQVIDKKRAKQTLISQVNHPVLWEDLIRQMQKDGASHFIEIGSGKVLKGLLRKIDKNLSVSNVETYEDCFALKEKI